MNNTLINALKLLKTLYLRHFYDILRQNVFRFFFAYSGINWYIFSSKFSKNLSKTARFSQLNGYLYSLEAVFKYRLQLSSFRTTSFAISSASAEINLYFLMVSLHSYLIFCNKKGGYGSFMSHCHQ